MEEKTHVVGGGASPLLVTVTVDINTMGTVVVTVGSIVRREKMSDGNWPSDRITVLVTGSSTVVTKPVSPGGGLVWTKT